MAKRSRGAAGRPGRRRPAQRPPNRPAPRPPVPDIRSSTPDDRAAPAVSPEGSDGPIDVPAPTARGRARVASSSFVESAAQEYAYVAADVRRIALVGGSLFGILIALFVLIEVLGIVHL